MGFNTASYLLLTARLKITKLFALFANDVTNFRDHIKNLVLSIEKKLNTLLKLKAYSFSPRDIRNEKYNR